MSTIQPKLTVSTPAAPKAAAPTKCPSPQDVAGDLRVQAGSDQARADELKAQADALRQAGTAKVNEGATQVAQGIATAAQGAANVAEGKLTQAEGQNQIQSGIDQEQAGLTQEKGGIDAFSSSLAEAKDLNSQSKTVSAMAALGVLSEGVYTAQAAEANKTFAQQLEEARGQAAELGGHLADLQTQSAAEADANNQVIAGNAQFDAGLAQNREGTASLISGVAHQTAAAGKGEQAAQKEKDAVVYQQHGESHAAQAAEVNQTSLDTSILAGKDWALAAKLEAKSMHQRGEGDNAMSVADLLARVSQIDNEAGAALQEIPGFLAEGNKNKADGENKAGSSEERKQAGATHYASADNFHNKSVIANDHAIAYAKEAADLAQQGKDLKDLSDSELATAQQKSDEAAALQAKADELQQLGDQQVAQGKADRLEGSMNAAAGLAAMTGGLNDEQAAHNAMNETSAKIPGVTDAMTANQAARQDTLAQADEAYQGISDSQDFLGQTVQVQSDLAAAKQANLEGRVGNLADIIAGEKAQTDGIQAQSDGLDKVQAGTDQENQGRQQITDGKTAAQQGKQKVTEGNKEITKGDQTGQAGAVLQNKADQYNAIANEVDPQSKK